MNEPEKENGQDQILLDLQRIGDAREHLAEHLGETPVLGSPELSDALGVEIALKAENLQRTGSFKIRGALHRILRLGDSEECPGVICASAGNHAQGVALAARISGLTATVVMPVATPLIKVARTRRYGAHVLLWGENYEEAYQRALDVGRERGYTYVHAFEDPDVMAGQGTIGLEILDQVDDLGAVVIPVGGGGLAAGMATAIKERRPEVAVYGVQAAGAAAMAASFESGEAVTLERAETIADAIRMRTASEVTLPILRRYLDGIVTVGEEAISEAMVRLLEETKMIVEGAGAVPLAAVMEEKIPKDRGRVVLMLCGGNMDLNMIGRVIEQGLSRAHRYLVLTVRVPDQPGRLHKLLSHFASKRVNVLDVDHRRAGWRIPLGQAEIELLLETRDEAHVAEILRDVDRAGYEVERGEISSGGAGEEEGAGTETGGRA